MNFFLYSSSVYSCYLFLIYSASVRSLPFLSFIESIFAWNIPLVSLNFLEAISSLSYSIVFLYFFALVTEEGFLISSCYSLELCIEMGISFLFSFAFLSFFFLLIIWRLITLQYCSGFCHTLKWISHGFTCVPHPDPPSRLPLHPIPLGLPSAPGLSTCLMHPTWPGDLFHPR